MSTLSPAAGRIQTVRGSIEARDIAVADAHGHVWIEPVAGASAPHAPVLNDYPDIAAELADYRAAGGKLILDCQPGGSGRNANKLRELSEDSGVHIVCVTGFYLRSFYPANHWLWKATEVAAAEFFFHELTAGTVESQSGAEPIRAGLIKIALPAEPDPQVYTLMRAAAAAANEAGCSLLFHTERGAWAENIAPFFDTLGVSPERMMICHIDKRHDIGLHRELAGAGFLLEYDTFLRPKYEPERHVWPLLDKMIAAGFAHSIALGLDAAQRELWAFGGGPGIASLPMGIAAQLRERGLPDGMIAGLLGNHLTHLLALRSL